MRFPRVRHEHVWQVIEKIMDFDDNEKHVGNKERCTICDRNSMIHFDDNDRLYRRE